MCSNILGMKNEVIRLKKKSQIKYKKEKYPEIYKKIRNKIKKESWQLVEKQKSYSR